MRIVSSAPRPTGDWRGGAWHHLAHPQLHGPARRHAEGAGGGGRGRVRGAVRLRVPRWAQGPPRSKAQAPQTSWCPPVGPGVRCQGCGGCPGRGSAVPGQLRHDLHPATCTPPPRPRPRLQTTRRMPTRFWEGRRCWQPWPPPPVPSGRSCRPWWATWPMPTATWLAGTFGARPPRRCSAASPPSPATATTRWGRTRCRRRSRACSRPCSCRPPCCALRLHRRR